MEVDSSGQCVGYVVVVRGKRMANGWTGVEAATAVRRAVVERSVTKEL